MGCCKKKSAFDAKGALLSGFKTDPIPEWTKKELPRMPQKRATFASVNLDENRVMVIGGRTHQKKKGYVINSCAVYNHLTRTWEQEGWPGLNVERQGHAAVCVNNKVLVFGGDGYENRRLDSIECLDLMADILRWELLEVKLSTARMGCTAAVVNNLIYVIGGCSRLSSRLTSVDVINANTYRVYRGPSLTSARWGSSAVVVESTIYVVGGIDRSGLATATIESLTPKKAGGTGQWMALREVKLQDARWCHSATRLDQSIVIVGGGGTQQRQLKSAEIFDTISQTCWKLPDLKTGRFGSIATVLDSQVVVMGGTGGSTHHACVETLHDLQRTPLILELQKQMESLGNKVEQLSQRLSDLGLDREGEAQEESRPAKKKKGKMRNGKRPVDVLS